MRAWLLALLSLVACVPVRDSRPPSDWERERPSVVVILDHLGGQGICSGVVIRNNAGHAVVATAAHCVSTYTAPVLGQAVWFFAGREVFARMGTLQSFDQYRDRCTLAASDLPHAMSTHKLFPEWPNVSGVHAVSALYEARSYGVIVGEVFAGTPGNFFWDSTIDVRPGWSGSPVFDTAGNVVGIVSKCRTRAMYPLPVCDRFSAIFTDPI